MLIAAGLALATGTLVFRLLCLHCVQIEGRDPSIANPASSAC